MVWSPRVGKVHPSSEVPPDSVKLSHDLINSRIPVGCSIDHSPNFGANQIFARPYLVAGEHCCSNDMDCDDPHPAAHAHRMGNTQLVVGSYNI